MARKVISQEDVFEAADEIFQAGSEPTTLAIHKILGRGSYTTIQNFLKLWEDAHKAERSRAQLTPLPEALERDGENLIRKIWMLATDAADEQMQAEREAIRQREIEMEKELRDAVDLADSAAEDVEKMQEAVENAHQDKESALSEAAVRVNDVSTKNSLLEAEVARLKSELDAAKQEGDQARNELHKARHDADSAQQRCEALENKLLEAKNQLDSQAREISEQAQTLAVNGETISGLTANLEETRGELAAYRQEAGDALAAKSELAGELKEKTRQIERLEANLQAQAGRGQDLESEILALNHELEEARKSHSNEEQDDMFEKGKKVDRPGPKNTDKDAP